MAHAFSQHPAAKLNGETGFLRFTLKQQQTETVDNFVGKSVNMRRQAALNRDYDKMMKF